MSKCRCGRCHSSKSKKPKIVSEPIDELEANAFILRTNEDQILEDNQPMIFHLCIKSPNIHVDETGKYAKVNKSGGYRIVFNGDVFFENSDTIMEFDIPDIGAEFKVFLTRKMGISSGSTTTIIPLKEGQKIGVKFRTPQRVIVSSGSSLQVYRVY